MVDMHYPPPNRLATFACPPTMVDFDNCILYSMSIDPTSIKAWICRTAVMVTIA